MRSFGRTVTSAFFFSAGVAAAIAAIVPAHAQQYTLRIATHYPATHLQAKAYAQFAEDVEKNSQGRIKTRVYPAETLVSTREAYDAVKSGVVEAAPMTSAFNVGKIPELDALHMPFLFDDATHFRRAINAGLFDRIAAMYKSNGIILLNYFHKGATHVYHRNKFLLAPADYKGVELRGLGGAMTEMLSALGANSVTLPTGEVSAAIERGVISGVMTNCFAHIANGWVDHLKFVSYLDLSQSAEGLGINPAFFNRLPPDLQKVVLDAAKRMEDAQWNSVIAADEKTCFSQWQDNKASVQKLSKEQRDSMRALMKPIYDKYDARLKLTAEVVDTAQKTRK